MVDTRNRQGLKTPDRAGSPTIQALICLNFLNYHDYRGFGRMSTAGGGIFVVWDPVFGPTLAPRITRPAVFFPADAPLPETSPPQHAVGKTQFAAPYARGKNTVTALA